MTVAGSSNPGLLRNREPLLTTRESSAAPLGPRMAMWWWCESSREGRGCWWRERGGMFMLPLMCVGWSAVAGRGRERSGAGPISATSTSAMLLMSGDDTDRRMVFFSFF